MRVARFLLGFGGGILVFLGTRALKSLGLAESQIYAL
jgi:hypothetical protein